MNFFQVYTHKDCWISFTLNYLRKLHTLFYIIDCTNLHCHQICMSIPFSLCPCQHLSLGLLTIAILMGMRWHLIVVLIYISLMITDVDCDLLTICISSEKKETVCSSPLPIFWYLCAIELHELLGYFGY